jgi:hypothetical protein
MKAVDLAMRRDDRNPGNEAVERASGRIRYVVTGLVVSRTGIEPARRRDANEDYSCVVAQCAPIQNAEGVQSRQLFMR